MQPNDNSDDRTNQIDSQVRAAVTPVCERLGVRSWKRAARLCAVLRDIDELVSEGASETELRLISGLIDSHIDERFAGPNGTDDKTADRHELEMDTAEDKIDGLFAIEGESATLCDEHAFALEKQAAASRVRARRRRKQARAIRSHRATARVRVGLA